MATDSSSIVAAEGIMLTGMLAEAPVTVKTKSSYPRNDTVTRAPLSALRENRPSASVTAYFPPETTVAPASGTPFSSVTTPFTGRDCARAASPSMRQSRPSAAFLILPDDYIPATTTQARPAMNRVNIMARRPYTPFLAPLNSFQMNTPQMAATMGAPCPSA